MDLPGSILGMSVGEGELYFFTVDCPIGVREHIHVCITRNNVNKFQRDITYINCNNVIEITESEFGNFIKDGKVHRLSGRIDEDGLSLISNGVKLSSEVERRIKALF